jgi:hypothetical protein
VKVLLKISKEKIFYIIPNFKRKYRKKYSNAISKACDGLGPTGGRKSRRPEKRRRIAPPPEGESALV